MHGCAVMIYKGQAIDDMQRLAAFDDMPNLALFRFGYKKNVGIIRHFCVGDPYGIRTHVTAVKGRCLNRLTKGPYDGSGGQIRTNDLPGMNRPL